MIQRLRSPIFISQPAHLPLNSRYTYATTSSITLLGCLRGVLNSQTGRGSFSGSQNAVFLQSFRMSIPFSDCLEEKFRVIFEQELRYKETKRHLQLHESIAESGCEPRQSDSRVYALYPYVRLLLYLINPLHIICFFI